MGRRPELSQLTKMSDLAELMGVSTSTVSRALNQHSTISPETRERVRRTAERYNYIPNSVARGLALKRSQLIGLMVPDIANPFFAMIARGAHDVACEKGFVVATCDTQRRQDRQELFSQTLVSSQAAGMIVTGGAVSEDRLKRWKDLRLPLVLAGTTFGGIGLSAVSVDNVAAGYQATQHLASLGHEKILFLGGPVESPGSRDRERGYRDFMRSKGFTPWIVREDYTIDSGFRQVAAMSDWSKWPTAVFAANDLMAIGLIMALTNRGCKVPEDVSIVGCDDVPLAALVRPALTTVRVPMYEIGRRAMELLLEFIREAENRPSQTILLNSELVVRESTVS